MIQVYDKYGKIKSSGTPGAGTVTSISSGNLSPLFTTAVTSPTSTPNIAFTAVSQAQKLFYASPNSGSGVPSFRTIQASDLPSLSGTYVPISRTLTINGVTYDLSADRTWTISSATNLGYTPSPTNGIVTSDTGTDATISLADGTNAGLLTPAEKTIIAGSQAYADAKVADAIVDGVTTIAPSQNAVFDALATKFTLPTLTSGSVLFSNGTTIAQDNSQLFWDDTNNRLGIGTNVPAFGKLEILSGGGAKSGLVLRNNATTGTYTSLDLLSLTNIPFQMGLYNSGDAFFYLTSAGSSINFYTNDILRLNIAKNGSIGIGTSSPTAKLHVAAQGALSTDIAFRVRNSADSADLLSLNGLGVTTINAVNENVQLRLTNTGAANNRSAIAFQFNNSGVDQAMIRALPGIIVGSYGRFAISTYNVFGGGMVDRMLFDEFGGVSIGASYAGNVAIPARLDVRAQGALSTDIAFRVRNSADTQNSLIVNGAGDVYNNGANGVASCTMFGGNAGRFSTGLGNSLFGTNAGGNTTTGANNSFFGSNAGRFNITSGSNSFFGQSAGENTTAGGNSFFGHNAGGGITTGESNVSFGWVSGRFISDGITVNTISNNSVFIGANTKPLANSQTNQIVIGDSAIGIGSNSVVLGNDSITKTALKGNVLINTTTDNGGKLQIKAPGALSTDIALRVRNSADTGEVFTISGNSSAALGTTPSSTAGRFTIGGSTGPALLLSGFYGVSEIFQGTGLYIKNNTSNFSTIFDMNNVEKMRLTQTGNLLINTTTDIASSKLTIDSTTQGFLPPRMTNAQRLAIASPAIGLIVYCTDATEGLYENTSAGWVNLNAIDATPTDGSANAVSSNGVFDALATKFELPALTSGSVLFSNGTTIAQDNANLYFDDVNNRLGIGTNVISSLSKVEIAGSLGLSTQEILLALNKRNDLDRGWKFLSGKNADTQWGSYSLRVFSGQSGDLVFGIGGKLRIGAGSPATADSVSGFTDNVTIQPSGNINIGGTVDSGFKLDVNGTTRLNGNTSIGGAAAGARLDIRAQGALSTDIAFRVRNSADTANLISVNGIGQTILTPATLTGSSATSALDITQTWNTTGAPTALKVNITDTASASLSDLMSLQVGGSVKFRVLKSGYFSHNTGGEIQGSLVVGSASINASAVLQSDSITKGFLPPRMTNAQRLAIASPAVGLMVYCTDVVEGLYINKSTGWTFVI